MTPPRKILQGEVVGGCTIERLIGQGGMGAVYLGRLPTGKLAAIKVLRPSSDGDAQREKRFRREAQTAALLDHPGIVKLLSADVDGDPPCLVMEYIEGRPLGDVFSDRGYDLNDKLTLLAQVCRATQFAHDLGIVHRDLKPENVLVTAGGRAKVLDFGVAKDLSRNTQLTKEGTTVGSPAYMAPEQVRGKEITPRTDVYALGILLYELLAGEVPYGGTTLVEVYQSILTGKLTPPSHAGQGGRAHDRVCLKAIAKVPDQRYDSALELAEAIEGLACLSPASPAKWPWVLGGVGVTLLVTSAALLGYGLGDPSESTPATTSKTPTVEPAQAIERPPAVEPPESPAPELLPPEPLAPEPASADPGPASVPVPPPRTARQWVEMARQHLRVREVTSAEEAYIRALELNPNDRSVWIELGHMHRRVKNLRQALHAFDRALELSAHDPMTLNFRANLRFQAGQYQGAIDDYSAGIALSRHPRSIFNRGNARLKIGDYQGALEDYNEALRSGGGGVPLAEIRYARAHAYQALGKSSEAVSDFEAFLAAGVRGSRAESVKRKIAKLRE